MILAFVIPYLSRFSERRSRSPRRSPGSVKRSRCMKTHKIACIVGTRPNFVKIAPIMREFDNRPRFEPQLIHTGQHYSAEMSRMLFEDLELRRPDVHLGIRGGGGATRQTAEIMQSLDEVLLELKPDLVLLVGDVNSTFAAAVVAAKQLIPIAHVEAGLRSFDRAMPEEINRILTDAITDLFFVTEPSGVNNLLKEGHAREQIFLVGNVMIDTLLRFRERAAASDVLERLGLKSRNYAVITLHRPSNVDDLDRLRDLMAMLREAASKIPVVFPVHPRTRQRMESGGISTKGILITPPLGYLDFLRLMDRSRLVLTDSGGIQEETTILQVPCLTLRENTERPVTVEKGSNRLVGVKPDVILQAIQQALEKEIVSTGIPEFWDGKAGKRIADILENEL